jgi:hypothetical protein
MGGHFVMLSKDLAVHHYDDRSGWRSEQSGDSPMKCQIESADYLVQRRSRGFIL